MTRADLFTFPAGAPGLLALLGWGEARGESVEGQIAVMCVARNRVNEKKWYGDGYFDVILKPQQFSCFNEDDPNLPYLLTIAESWTTLAAEHPQPLRQIIFLARGIVDNDIMDNTEGANHYFSTKILPPTWASHGFVKEIGNHLFYKLP